MKLIKFQRANTITLDGKKYKPYLIGGLPQRFAFLFDNHDEQEGITTWFNYKGFTYVPAQKQTI